MHHFACPTRLLFIIVTCTPVIPCLGTTATGLAAASKTVARYSCSRDFAPALPIHVLSPPGLKVESNLPAGHKAGLPPGISLTVHAGIAIQLSSCQRSLIGSFAQLTAPALAYQSGFCYRDTFRCLLRRPLSSHEIRLAGFALALALCTSSASRLVGGSLATIRCSQRPPFARISPKPNRYRPLTGTRPNSRGSPVSVGTSCPLVHCCRRHVFTRLLDSQLR